MADTIGAGVGGPATSASWFFGPLALDDPRCPLLARPGQEVERAELVHADDDARIALLRFCLAIGNLIELEHPVLLGLEVGVVGLLVGLDHLKRDTLLAEEHAQTLVTDVVNAPSATRNSASFGQAQVEKGRSWSTGRLESDLLDLPALRQGEFRWSAPRVSRGQRLEPVSVEVVDDLSDPVLRGEGDLGDGPDIHPLGRPEHDLGSSPSHHRARSPAHDGEELSSLLVGDVPDCHAFCHGITLRDLDLKVVDAPPERCRLQRRSPPPGRAARCEQHR